MSLVLQQRPRACQYGSNSTLHSSQTGTAGTPFYIAPELANGAAKLRYTVKSDVYSFGIVFLEMSYPFGTRSELAAVLKAIQIERIQIPINLPEAKMQVNYFIQVWFNVREPIDVDFVCLQILQLMLNADPNGRPTAVEARLKYKEFVEGDELLDRLREIGSRPRRLHRTRLYRHRNAIWSNDFNWFCNFFMESQHICTSFYIQYGQIKCFKTLVNALPFRPGALEWITGCIIRWIFYRSTSLLFYLFIFSIIEIQHRVMSAFHCVWIWTQCIQIEHKLNCWARIRSIF